MRNSFPRTFVALLVTIFAFGAVAQEDLDYSALQGGYSDAKALLTPALLAKVPGDTGLFYFKTYIEETDLYLAEKPARTQDEIYDVLRWLNRGASRAKRWEPREVSPPLPLVESGDKVIPAPEGIDPFYSKYTNAYEGDYTQGIPVLGAGNIPDEYLLKIRLVVNTLLRKRPDIRAAMVEKNFSMGMTESTRTFGDHPRRGYQTLQEIDVARGNIDEYCPIEEFLHAMHAFGINKVDPEVARAIVDAYKAAVEKGDIYNASCTIGYEDEWERMGITRSDFANDENRKRLFLSPKVVASFVPMEYFAMGAVVWFGSEYPERCFFPKTREELKEKDPVLAEIFTLYFDEDDETACISTQYLRRDRWSDRRPDQLDYTKLDATYRAAKALLTDDMLANIPGNLVLLNFRTHLEETALFLQAQDAQSQQEIDDVMRWLPAAAKRAQAWEPEAIPAPTVRIASGNKVIDAPTGIHSFYSKYTNAYETNPERGIPILAPQDVPDDYVLRMRAVVNMLLHKRPDIRKAMVDQSFSMAMSSRQTNFNEHPEGNSRFRTLQEMNGNGGIEEFWPIEEFVHAMETISINKVDPGVNREILDAYKAAVIEGGTYNAWGTIGSNDQWEEFALSDADFANDATRTRLYLSPKIVASFVPMEYFAAAVRVWHGDVYPVSNPTSFTKSSADLAERDPAIVAIIERYFSNENWIQSDRQ